MRREVGSITQIAPGVFRISVSVGYSTVTGRRRRPSQIVRGTEREAEIALARLLLSAGKLPENEVSLRQFLEEMYLPHVEKRRRAKTVDGYRSLISHHIVPELGNSALTDLTPYQLSRWLDGLSKVGSDPVEPLSEQSRLHVYRCLFLSLIHISEPTRLLSISYAVFCLKKKNLNINTHYNKKKYNIHTKLLQVDSIHCKTTIDRITRHHRRKPHTHE